MLIDEARSVNVGYRIMAFAISLTLAREKVSTVKPLLFCCSCLPSTQIMNKSTSTTVLDSVTHRTIGFK